MLLGRWPHAPSRRAGDEMTARRSSALLASAVLVALGMGSSPSPLRAAAKYDYDPSIDFTKYRTFGLLGDSPVGVPRGHRARQERPALSPLAEKHIEEALRTGLAARGLEYREELPVDLIVTFYVGKHREVVGYRWGPRHVGPRRVLAYEEGMLTVDLIGRDTRELVWRGSIAATLKEDPGKLHKQIESLVEKVVKNYPPPR
jgi:hypothetical protein